MKRMKRQIKKPPNPLFEKWLLELQKDAAEQGSELQHSLGKAIRSLKKYPFPLLSGKECIILENFGQKICEMIDKKLTDYKKSFTEDEWEYVLKHGHAFSNESEKVTPSLATPTKRKTVNNQHVNTINNLSDSEPENSAADSNQPQRVERKGRDYVPKHRSGGYALLIALIKHHSATMEKSELITQAQPFCDSSFIKPPPGSHYTAWSSMATLLKRNLVVKTSKPIRYELTDDGRKIAQKLVDIESGTINPSPSKASVISTTSPQRSTASPAKSNSRHPNSTSSMATSSSSSSSSGNYHENIISSGTSNTLTVNSQTCHSLQNNELSNNSSESNVAETFFLLPGNFDIILLVDIHETEMRGKKRVDASLQAFRDRRILCEARHLAVGDFVWICRDRTNSMELVLPYVLERKRMDDFAASVKDGRFHEQKFRLKQCGLSNVIYLVENYGKDVQRLGLPLSSLQQAAANTQLVDGFLMNFTNSHDDSILYISCVTRSLISLFKNKTLISCSKKDLQDVNISSDLMSLITFKEFNRSSTKIKNWTVRDMLIKQLVQLKGLSVEKATAIAAKFPTPQSLVSVLLNEGEKAIADISAGPLRRIGPATAKTLHQLYTQIKLQ